MSRRKKKQRRIHGDRFERRKEQETSRRKAERLRKHDRDYTDE